MKPAFRKLRWLRKQLVLYNFSKLFNWYFDLYTGGNKRRVVFDVAETFPELRHVQDNYNDIREELEALLPSREEIPRYHELDGDLIYASGRFQRDKSWNVFMLYSYGTKMEFNRNQCPKTSVVLDRIPHLAQAFFSILEGGKSIPAHEGPTRSYLRYHLALKTPEINPPSIRIKDVWHTWKAGESLFFDDSWEHEIVNDASEIRAVLIVDVLRPMPWFPSLVNRALFQVGRFYGRRIGKAAAAHRQQISTK